MDIPAFPLQNQVRQHATWRDTACVLVKDDRPAADILWANLHARRLGIQRGMRFGEAQALAHALHAEVFDAAALSAATDEVWQLLLRFTPNVEPSTDMPGVFWLDPNGLTQVFSSLEVWAAAVHKALVQAGWVTTVAVGFNRYHVFAVARGHKDSIVIPSREAEEAWAKRVPLKRLDVSLQLMAALQPLGLQTLGDLLALPVAEMRQRLGEEAEHIYRMVHETLWTPLTPKRAVEPYACTRQIEPADADHGRLMFVVKSMLPGLAAQLRDDMRVLLALEVVLELDHHAPVSFTLEPAAPAPLWKAEDERALLELIRLRLASFTLPAPVQNIALTARSLPMAAEQLKMLQQRPKRDVRAAADALAKLKAALGNQAVTRARLCPSHLPEASFSWQQVSEIVLPQKVGAEQLPPLIRRLVKPTLLPPRPRHDPSSWLQDRGTVADIVGPFRITTAWWAEPQARDYFYVTTQCGDILWTYYDRVLGRWFLHGMVD